MKKVRASKERFEDRDTMRPEYDFTGAVRGVTAARYGQGTNIVAVDPEVRDVFPNGGAVNDALRALAPLLREQRGRPGRTKRPTRPRPRGCSGEHPRARLGRGG
ncbi:MAG: hypothetical protein ACHQ9S_20745 [Candidatus Binatia bacterium]